MKKFKFTVVIQAGREYTEEDVKLGTCFHCCGVGKVNATIYINSLEKAKYSVVCPNCSGTGRASFVSNFLSRKVSVKETDLDFE